MISNKLYFEKLNFYFKNSLPFCSFRPPNKNIATCYSSKTTDIPKIKNPRGSGFIISSFNTEKGSYLIPPDTVISTKILKLKTHEYVKSNKKETNLNKHKKDYIDAVSDIIDRISKSELVKMVYSRSFEFELESHNVFDVYKNILNLYPSAYCYLFFHPSEGFWMGASPETLLEINKTKISTMALAGTKKINDSNWGHKELNEQKIVQEEIKKNLTPLCNNLNFQKTISSNAGDIKHLKTIITGNTNKSPREIINKLHPTPATAGVPLDKALSNIFLKEKHDRSFYAGYLGIIDDYDCELYVNLRSMNISNNIVKVFVGGGITSDSEPENEWEEIVQKSQTMLKVIF